MSNLINFPTVNCVTLKSSKQRQEFILQQTEKYGLKCNFTYAYDGVNHSLEELAKVESPFLSNMNIGEICAVISHIKAITNWYYNTDEEYGFFCEDDILLSLNENWTFTWDELVSKLPENWGIVQLSLIRNFESDDIHEHVKFHQYVWDNWSACAYIISRGYAEQLINFHVRGEDVYNLNLPFYPETTPYIENVLYNVDNKASAYTLPLFVENSDIISSFYPKFLQTESKNDQRRSSELVKNWWETNGRNKSIGWFFGENSIDMNLLVVSPNYQESKRIFIVDNFYKDPDAVREFALQQEYFDDPGYVGRRTRKQFFLPGIKEAFEEIMNHKITRWEEHGMNARFQHNWAGESLVYHCDSQTWAGIIYLTPDAPPECGTSTWRHKKTKIHHNTQIDWESGVGNQVFNQRTFVDRTPYEPVDVCGNIYNRLVIFSGGCIHSASEYFGDCLENCRLWHMFFWD